MVTAARPTDRIGRLELRVTALCRELLGMNQSLIALAMVTDDALEQQQELRDRLEHCRQIMSKILED